MAERMTRMQKFHPELQEEPPKRITRMERFAHLREEPEKPEVEEHLANLERRAVLPRSENQENGRKVLDAPSVRRQMMNSFTGMVQPRPRSVLRPEVLKGKELFSDYGARSLNKGDLTGNPNRPIEDRAYVAPEKGVFAVFDGAGGVKNAASKPGGAEAAKTACDALSKSLHDRLPSNLDEMAEVMSSLNEAVGANPNAGMATAVVGRIIESDDGKKHLLFASMGDSRIYQTRQGHIRQLTQDEGVGNRISNALGYGDGGGYCKQIGTVNLEAGDSLLFCSDGITGDFEKDFIPDHELGHLIDDAPTATGAAENLIRRATKIDDRTAVVVRI